MVLKRATALLAGLLLAAAAALVFPSSAADVEWMRQPHPLAPPPVPASATEAAAAAPASSDVEWMRHPHPAPPLLSPEAADAGPEPSRPEALLHLPPTLEALRHPHPLTEPDVVAARPAPGTAFHSEDRIADSEESYAEDPAEADQSDGSDSDDPASEQEAIAAAMSKPYIVASVAPEGLRFTDPKLPDLRPYTAEALRARIPHGPRGEALISRMLQEVTFKGFMGRDERLREWASRQSSLPKVIFIRNGTMTPRDLARELPREAFEETERGVYIARLPIDVRPGAALVIDRDVKEFRLSTDRGAFIANEGRLFVYGTLLQAWSEGKRAPTAFTDKHAFRPFIVSWGGSETYIAKSRIAHLGYAASKSYGLSITQFGPTLSAQLKRSRPTGWILDSEFYDLWYGFYCYEADDVVIRNNVFHDNIKYGIDPHDRSRGLIIAGNTAYGTKEKHGIIVSREVNDSWIIDNKSYENALSGIVVDRSSVNNVVAHNEVYRNASDGITIYESPDTVLWQNVSTGNGRHGMRVRNSTGVKLYDNVAVGNNLAGIYGHIKDLAGTGRNLRIDPFHQKVSMVVVGGQLVSNGSGPVTIDQPLSLELYNVDLRAPRRELGIKFTGVLGTYQDQVLDILVRQHLPVVLRPDVQRTAKN